MVVGPLALEGAAIGPGHGSEAVVFFLAPAALESPTIFVGHHAMAFHLPFLEGAIVDAISHLENSFARVVGIVFKAAQVYELFPVSDLAFSLTLAFDEGPFEPRLVSVVLHTEA